MMYIYEYLRQTIGMIWVILCVLPCCLFAYDLDPTLQLKIESGYYQQRFQRDLTQEDRPNTELHAPYFLLEASYEVLPAWVLDIGYQAQFFSQQRIIQRIQGGLRYQLDILHYIPWVGIIWCYDLYRAEAWNTANKQYQNFLSNFDEENASRLALNMIDASMLGDPLQWGIEIGVDRRLNPNHVLSFTFRWLNVTGLSETPSVFSFGLAWSYRWLLVDPFDD